MPKVKKTQRGKTATEEEIRKIAAMINDSDNEDAYMYGDDEDISEDEIFTKDDDAKWGDVINPILKRGGAPAKASDDEDGSASDDDDDDIDDDLDDDSDDDDDDDDSDGDSYSEDGDVQTDDDGEEEEEEDDGAVTLMDVFDVNNENTAPKSKTKKPVARKDVDSDEDLSSEEDGELTEEQQRQLLAFVQQISGEESGQTAKSAPKRRRLAETGGDASAENEYSAATSGQLSLSDLLAGSSVPGLEALKQRLVGSSSGSKRRREEMTGPLRSPPNSTAQKRADRAEAYGEVKQFVSRWGDLVQINRQAPHLSFSAEAQGAVGDRARGLTATALAASMRPQNELEAAIAEALVGSGVGALPSTRTAGAKTSATGDAAVMAAEQAELELLTRMVASAEGDDEEALPNAGVDPETFERRQKELAKMRALLFYEEIKKKRQNKIKSKAYRRLKARVDSKRGATERDELRKLDPEAAAKLDDEEARLLAKERMTLKHRAGKGVGGSKWVKRVLARGGGSGQDVATKQGLTEHLKRAQDLQARMRGAKGQENSDDDDDDLDEELDTAQDPAEMLAKARQRLLKEAGLAEDGEDAPKPRDPNEKYAFDEAAKAGHDDGEGPNKGLFSMRFMKNAAAKARSTARLEAIEIAEEMNRKEAGMRGHNGGMKDDYQFDEDDFAGSGSDHDDAGSDNGSAEKHTGAGENLDFAGVALEGDGAAPVESTQKKSKRKAESQPAMQSGRVVFAGPSDAAPSARPRASQKDIDAVNQALGKDSRGSLKVKTKEAMSAAVAPAKNAWLTQGVAATAAVAANVAYTNNDSQSAANPWLSSNAFNSGAYSAGNAAAAVAISRHTATARAKSGSSEATPVLDIAAGMQLLKEPSNKGGKLSEQDELMKRAFAGFGATAEELSEEKEKDTREAQTDLEGKRASKGRSNEEIQTAAGWGTWAGLGAASAAEQLAAARAKDKRRSKLATAVTAKPAAPAPVRKDARLATVVISEKRDKKLARQYQPTTVPFPFQTREQYEASLRQPVGPEWNTAATLADMTRPEVTTRAGVIIKPIQYVKVKRGKELKASGATRESASAVATAFIKKDNRR